MKKVHSIFFDSALDFESTALDVFRYQSEHLEVFKTYLEFLDFPIKKVRTCSEIPFLPISFYKTHKVLANGKNENRIFKSSGTTATPESERSKLYLSDDEIYTKSALHNFQSTFGSLKSKEIFALLPSYSERNDSSLVFMVDFLMQQSESPKNNYFLKNWDEMIDKMRKTNKEIVLFAVSFALLDFVEAGWVCDLPITIVETGGMKGRKKEIIKEEFFRIVKPAFPNAKFCSEYGMTELLSQAYSLDGFFYKCPNWMKVFVREAEDPFNTKESGIGVLNIIDLAATNNCSFIATDDLAVVDENGYFRVLGRLDHSDARGCSQMIV